MVEYKQILAAEDKVVGGAILTSDLSEVITQKLHRYAELLAAANERARLTGSSDPDVIYSEHIADALSGLPWLPESGSFVDVGTGGGLPGLVWAICRPDLTAVLLDSIGKKCNLLNEIIAELGCTNAVAVNTRSEDFAKVNRETFDMATARAVAHSCILAEYLAPLVKTGGKLLAFKGESAADEIKIPSSKWRLLGLDAPSLHPYTTCDKNRLIVLWKKLMPTPPRYPRNPGMAEKKPWYRALPKGRASS